jgi:hypothetical protein
MKLERHPLEPSKYKMTLNSFWILYARHSIN